MSRRAFSAEMKEFIRERCARLGEGSKRNCSTWFVRTSKTVQETCEFVKAYLKKKDAEKFEKVSVKCKDIRNLPPESMDLPKFEGDNGFIYYKLTITGPRVEKRTNDFEEFWYDRDINEVRFSKDSILIFPSKLFLSDKAVREENEAGAEGEQEIDKNKANKQELYTLLDAHLNGLELKAAFSDAIKSAVNQYMASQPEESKAPELDVQLIKDTIKDAVMKSFEEEKKKDEQENEPQKLVTELKTISDGFSERMKRWEDSVALREKAVIEGEKSIEVRKDSFAEKLEKLITISERVEKQQSEVQGGLDELRRTQSELKEMVESLGLAQKALKKSSEQNIQRFGLASVVSFSPLPPKPNKTKLESFVSNVKQTLLNWSSEDTRAKTAWKNLRVSDINPLWVVKTCLAYYIHPLNILGLSAIKLSDHGNTAALSVVKAVEELMVLEANKKAIFQLIRRKHRSPGKSLSDLLHDGDEEDLSEYFPSITKEGIESEAKKKPSERQEPIFIPEDGIEVDTSSEKYKRSGCCNRAEFFHLLEAGLTTIQELELKRSVTK